MDAERNLPAPESLPEFQEDVEASMQRATDFLMALHVLDEAAKNVAFELATGDGRR